MSAFPIINAQNVVQIMNHFIQAVEGGSSLSSSEQIDLLIDGLPHINEKQLADLGEKESSCPICFTSYLAIIAEEELALAMESPAHPVDMIGVTKLSQPWQCGHMFCRRDISKWIIDGHNSCPLCRHTLVEGNQGWQDNEGSSESLPPDTDSDAITEYIRARLANVPIDLASGFNPELPLQRGESSNPSSGMYS